MELDEGRSHHGCAAGDGLFQQQPPKPNAKGANLTSLSGNQAGHFDAGPAYWSL
jgi:hypothetical protein